MTMDQKNALIEKICTEARILPVITIGSEEQILPLADALAAGGLTALEITLRSAHGLTAIRRLRQERPNLCVGAGTVLDKRMMDEVEAAGAQFIVSPGCTDELLQAGVNCSVPLLAGISNASDIMRGYALGYRRFKLFPAEVCGGVAAIKALGGPFADVRFGWFPVVSVRFRTVSRWLNRRAISPQPWLFVKKVLKLNFELC